MTDTLAILRRKIDGANELSSVVRTMKAVAASSIAQYFSAVLSLADYEKTIHTGLAATIGRLPVNHSAVDERVQATESPKIHAVVFGSDQGLVGKFNESLVGFVVKTLATQPGQKVVWAVGERLQGELADGGHSPKGIFLVPNSVTGITSLVGQILEGCVTIDSENVDRIEPLYIFHNRQKGGGSLYESVVERLLPLDSKWLLRFSKIPWPNRLRPEVIGNSDQALGVLIREYLFVAIFKASAESLATENACRLNAMQRAEKNIEALLDALGQSLHQLRQNSIDEELFDIIAGFEALTK